MSDASCSGVEFVYLIVKGIYFVPLGHRAHRACGQRNGQGANQRRHKVQSTMLNDAHSPSGLSILWFSQSSITRQLQQKKLRGSVRHV